LRQTIERVTAAFDRFEFGVAADTLLDFIWYTFCDWYIESSKEQTPTRAAVLSFTFNNAVRLLHPICPFVTEEMWQALPHDGATVVTASWPDPAEVPADYPAAERFEALIRVVTKARDLRSELGLPPKEKMTLDVPAALDKELRALLARHVGAEIVETPADSQACGDERGAAELLAAVTVRAPAEVLRARYAREIERLDGETARLEKKLGNEQFIGKASPEVVRKEREKLAEYEAERARASERLRQLG
jgi:valyl-tRNA synthetase